MYIFNVQNGKKLNLIAIANLVATNCSHGEDDNNNTPKASNRTIDLSKVDFLVISYSFLLLIHHQKIL